MIYKKTSSSSRSS